LITKTFCQRKPEVGLSKNLAHELRTPLRTIASYIIGLRKYLPDLLCAYQKAEAAKLEIPSISLQKIEILQNSLDNIEHEVNNMFSIIDALLITTGVTKTDTNKDNTSNVITEE
jgi:signal transduction histidine kinase